MSNMSHEHEHQHRPHDQVTPESMEHQYTSAEQIWSGNPNQALVAYLGTHPAPHGTALDIGCGEGADLVWLAAQGFETTGIDFAPTAVTRAKHNAPDSEVLLVAFTEFSIESGRQFDVVSCSYGQIPANDISVGHLENLVAPGGTLLFTHHDFDSESAATPKWLAEHLSSNFTVEVLESFERDIKTGAGAHHHVDIVLKAKKVS
ncbi:SAM-dependent methyltransferase [Corynebacterium crudilactis]|uniref:SAM-dependent methyltransferase n=2 Tax=Corynebacterium crudilactis TaxID=1652495 RepID=A0A172QT06_9CORY|nr:class I SAM-dependent methyltransferase [Corynebacterium crudilactis]ANE03839.1 SAM-dependent methyltransferase [Corynebacterium crudilactis]